jgi:ribosomal protein S18 acetylase RimI-like enzyme
VIEYTTDTGRVEPGQLRGFFVGWPNPPSPERHVEILRGSSHVVLAWDGERIVGFITAISDGVISAYIPLLEVVPEYQGRGIGAGLVRRLLAQVGELYMVDLCCDEDVVGFYERLGLHRWDAGMGLRNREAL